MRWVYVILSIFVLVSGQLITIQAQETIVFKQPHHLAAIPINSIDSIIVNGALNSFNLYLTGKSSPIAILADSAFYHQSLPDTLMISFHEDFVEVQNPRLDCFQVETNGTNVFVFTAGKTPLKCLVNGNCSNGRLVVDCDTISTFILDGLSLTSLEGSVICLNDKQPSEVILKDNTMSIITDVFTYNNVEGDKSNACMYSKGPITFTGQGDLYVQGNYNHAISSSKDVTINSGHIHVMGTVNDGVHCDKFTLNDGLLGLSLSSPATKGIKTKKSININGGRIEGKAFGDLVIEDGETTYCTLIKSDSAFMMNDGEIDLKHYGNGGRCLSVDAGILMTGGRLELECHGDGGGYITAANDSDYYTSKCIKVDGQVHFERGQIKMLATGSGGKGLDCSDSVFIGRNGDSFISPELLSIEIETCGTALVDNVEEDYRQGCPKAIKSDSDIDIYSGNISLMTHGQGGEGIESKGALRTYNCTIYADCFDDGINTGNRCYINGAHIYCRSLNNDGIDSNGKLSVMDGIVAAISEHGLNECFDTEGGRLYVYGGHVIGIGCNEVVFAEQTTVSYYSTRMHFGQLGERYGDGIVINQNKHITISKSNNAIISLFHENAFSDTFITVASPLMEQGEIYHVSDGEMPVNPLTVLFDERVIVGGTINNWETLYNFKPN